MEQENATMQHEGPPRLGSLFVVENECSFAADRRNATIVIESVNPDHPRAIEELQAVDARKLAQAYAASKGVSSPCINGNVVTYPVNDEGTALDKVADTAGQRLPPQHIKMQVAKYRADVLIAAKLV